MSEQRARVIFLVRVPAHAPRSSSPRTSQVRHLVADGVPGHPVDQVCRSSTDPEQWLITSEWASLADFESWERTEEHRDLVRPMRECFTDARSLRFHIHAQTPALA
ncbi:antibiotic biosynthesis monooxygenase [Micromonospora sp. NBC_00617]